MQITATTTLRRVLDGAPLGTGPDNTKGSLWMLTSNDLAATIEAASYLNAAAGMLRKGDVIMASLDNDGTPVGKDYIVTAISPNVTIVAFV